MVLTVLLAGMFTGHAAAYPFGESRELSSQDATANEKFGSAVAISGDGTTAAVGSPGALVNGVNCGVVQVFVKQPDRTWTRQARLSSSQCSTNALFGSAIALTDNGSRMIVGAPGGSYASVWTRSGNTWTETGPFGDGIFSNVGYGASVDITGDGQRIVVGAPLYNLQGTESGRAYIFKRNLAQDWIFEDYLGFEDLYNYRRFGEAISINDAGTKIAVGAPGANATISTIRFFHFEDLGDYWTDDDVLVFSLWEGGRVGASLDMARDGNTVVAGAPAITSNTGAMLPLTPGSFGWSSGSTSPTTYPGSAPGDELGKSVATTANGSLMLAGAPGANSSKGTLHAYTKSGNTWIEAAQSPSPDGVSGDRFGSSVALSDDGNTAIVGAPGADRDSTTDRGAAYIFQRTVYNVNVNVNGAGSVTSSPTGINCGATCSASFSQGASVVLTATAEYGNRFAGWTGACSGTGTCGLPMNSNKTVTATFEPAAASINVQKKGLGSGTVTSNPAGINCGPTCFSAFEYGRSVALQAQPNDGSIFTGWGGACAEASDDTTCFLEADKAHQVTATFAGVPKTLSVTRTGTGGGTVVSNPGGLDCLFGCTGEFEAGSFVTVTAKPNRWSKFSGWTGECVGAGLSCRIQMTENKTVGVKFTAKPTNPNPDGGKPNLKVRVCGRLPGSGAYKYISTKGISCRKGIRLTSQARKQVCRPRNNCRSSKKSRTFRGTTRVSGWRCEVTVRYESSRVLCQRGIKYALKAAAS